MRPTDEEIEKQVNLMHVKQRKLYRRYKFKSYFGINTKGLTNNNSLILFAILEKNKNSNLSFVVVNNINQTNAKYLEEYHKEALRIDEKNYVTIFFKVNEKFGDFIIGEYIKYQLSLEDEKKLREKFKKQVSEQNYMKATERLIKAINKKFAKINLFSSKLS